ncbi:MAG TPA: GNAT family N-acetyltransferase [Holophagaceae bacterium]|nr:GNAT family N-acetyltransferase [Holophagaceae bacterium]
MDTVIRPAGPGDLETFVAHRCDMFRDMAYGDEAGLARMAPEFRALLRTWLTTGQVRGWIAEADGQPVGGALLELKEALPSPLTPQRIRGYLFNVYVAPEARGAGLARRLTQAALEEAQRLGLEMVELHASRDAEPLYRGMGFEPTPEFRLILSGDFKKPGQWTDRR